MSFLILLFGMMANAKTAYEVSIISDSGKATETVDAKEAKKMYPLKTGSKKNLCFLMKNDNSSLTLFCRSYPKSPSGPKDKNYITVSQHITCSSSVETSVGMTDAETEQSIMITVSCIQDKT